MKTDREVILDALRRGPVTSYEIRVNGWSGNPAERIRELKAEGHEIESEPGFRISGGRRRNLTVYTLAALAPEKPELVAGGGDANGGTSRSGSDTTSSSPPPAPTPLFEVPADHARTGHIDVDQRDAA